jgi:hypothetical protein
LARFNRRHRLFGHLFSGRYKALVVDGSGDGYLGTVCDYVHLNPMRAKLLREEQPLRAYRWSSYGKAQRVVREELKKAGWEVEELARRPKGDPVKVAVAKRLRRETTMTLKWISQHLRMGAWTHLNKRLYEERKANTGRRVDDKACPGDPKARAAAGCCQVGQKERRTVFPGAQGLQA